MEREELESLIRDKILKEQMPYGLYDTGIWVVRVYEAEAGICFEWCDHPTDITAYIDC